MLELRLDQLHDPGERAEEAREVAARARVIESIAGTVMRSAVQAMRSGGASHADVATRFGVTRARAQQLAGIPVLLAGGPRAGETIAAAPQANSRPNRHIVVAMPEYGVVNYWRRVEPEPDESWIADYYPGTQTPPDFIEDLTIR